MAKIVSMLNMKGGVGKTTLAVNMASCLAKLKDKKVLLIDLDPQYNATQYLVNLERHPEFVNGEQPTVFDIMAGESVSAFSVANGSKLETKPRRIGIQDVKRTIYAGNEGKGVLDLIPGTLHLIRLEMSLGRGTENKLRRFVKEIEGAYEFIFIDCPPTFSIFLLSGFLASDYYVVPLKPDPLSTLGIPLLERVIDVYSETYGKEIQPRGIIFTMVRNTKEMHNVMEDIRDTSAEKRYVFKNVLSMSTRVAEASRRNLPLFECEDAVKYGDEIKRITNEFLELF